MLHKKSAGKKISKVLGQTARLFVCLKACVSAQMIINREGLFSFSKVREKFVI